MSDIKQQPIEKPKAKWVKQQQLYDPNQKQYIVLSEQGRTKYNEISRNAYKTLLLWSTIGLTGGYTIYKFMPYISFVKRWQQLPRNLFIAFSVFFTYYGYKLMERQKKRGRIHIAKDDRYIMTQDQYSSRILSNKEYASKRQI